MHVKKGMLVKVVSGNHKGKKIIEPNKEYRATQIWLTKLELNKNEQLGLFDNQIKIQQYKSC